MSFEKSLMSENLAFVSAEAAFLPRQSHLCSNNTTVFGDYSFESIP